MPTVLIGPSHLRGQPGPFRTILEAGGFTVIDPVGHPALNEAELQRYLPETDAILCGGEVMTAAMFELARRLRVVARVGVGFDAVDIPAATQHKVPITITPGANQGSVSEQTFSLLFAITRNIIFADADVRSCRWTRPLPEPIRGKTFGIVGLGRIGKAVAVRARAFEMNVIACDDIPDHAFDAANQITRVSLDELYAQADIVSLHCPMMESTARMIHKGSLAKMKPGAILLNTARGGLVNEADLRDALVSGHLRGAGLDVLDQEPPTAESSPLLDAPNVVFSPHIGGIDTKGMADMAAMAARSNVDLHEGRWPTGCVVNDSLEPNWTW
jgi:phosphoglycerate dehydrogenase-like enzyme